MILSSSLNCEVRGARCEVQGARCKVQGSPSLRVLCTCGHFFTTRGEHIVCLALSSLGQGAARCFSCGGAASMRAHGWHQAAARSGPASTTAPCSSRSPRPYRPAGFSVGRGAREQEQVLTAPTRTRRSAAAPRSRAHCTDGRRTRCRKPAQCAEQKALPRRRTGCR